VADMHVSQGPRDRIVTGTLVLLVLGALGIYVEFSAPGLILPGVAGAILAYFALGFIAPRIPYFLTISAASFLYIGMVDIAPILHHDSGLKKSFVQLTGLFAGVVTILILHQTLE